ncbi:DUF1636 family protein [Oricola sp.]|uniref:DUF1636 family protein n=1 Tax=Oricola sp. TaxID=1979950 RepID=UPI003BA89911
MGSKCLHRILVCTTCSHNGGDCRPGYDLIDKLSKAIRDAGYAVPEDFTISGTACMAGCGRPCTVAYQASAKTAYLFGDIDPETDIADLVEFAGTYANTPDGWTKAGDRPGKLALTTLARLPSAVIVTGADERPLS